MYAVDRRTSMDGTCTCDQLKFGKVTKSIRWMPWHEQAMKDVVICDKPRVAETGAHPRISEWGNPAGVMSSHPKGS